MYRWHFHSIAMLWYEAWYATLPVKRIYMPIKIHSGELPTFYRDWGWKWATSYRDLGSKCIIFCQKLFPLLSKLYDNNIFKKNNVQQGRKDQSKTYKITHVSKFYF